MPIRLLAGIRQFKNNKIKKMQNELASLSQGQSPDVILITCADSRIDPNLFTYSNLGQIFNIRNAGNIIPPNPNPQNPSGDACTIEYGLEALKIEEIIVCGHSHCGAMKGLLTHDLEATLPQTAAWINHSKHLVDDLEQRHPELSQDASEKLKCLTQDNILLQVDNLKTHPAVSKRLNTLKIHAWYYEIETGEVYIYNEPQKAFLTFEQTVRNLAETELNNQVTLKASSYLNAAFRAVQSSEDFIRFQQLFNEVRFNGVDTIWSRIKTEVTTDLHKKVGALFVNDKGQMHASFDDILKQGPLVKLQSLQDLQTQMNQSPWNKAFSISHISMHRPVQRVTDTSPTQSKACIIQ